jgi:signal peptidase I
MLCAVTFKVGADINTSSPQNDYDAIFMVTSGSMKPTLCPSDVIFCKNISDVSEITVGPAPLGDIIAFRSPRDLKDIIVHRAIDKWYENGTWFFTTKGDANLNPDYWAVPLDLVFAKVVMLQRTITVLWNITKYQITIITNSALDTKGKLFDPLTKQIVYDVIYLLTQSYSYSWCNVTVSKSLLNGNFTVSVNGTQVIFDMSSNATHTSLTFNFSKVPYNVKIEGTTIKAYSPIKTGHWVEYSNFIFKWKTNTSINPPEELSLWNQTEWAKVEVQEVSGLIIFLGNYPPYYKRIIYDQGPMITYKATFHFKNNTEETYISSFKEPEYSFPLFPYSHFPYPSHFPHPLLFLPIISGLKAGESISLCPLYSYPYYRFKINQTVSLKYGGMLREINFLNLSKTISYESNHTVYLWYYEWDRETGFPMRFQVYFLWQNQTANLEMSCYFKMVDTNIWNTGLHKYLINVANQSFTMTIQSNSTISNFNFGRDEKKISFVVEGTPRTIGYCNITIPMDLLGGPYTVIFDDTIILAGYNPPTNGTHAFIHITYTHSTHTIEITGTTVIPEYPSIRMLLTLVMTTTLLIAALRKKGTKTLEKMPSRR